MPIELLFQGLRDELVNPRQRRREDGINPGGAAAGRDEDIIMAS
jgi:hypothetical protein